MYYMFNLYHSSIFFIILFYFILFFLFYHFGNENKDFLKLLQLPVGKKMPSKFALLKQHVFAHYKSATDLGICNMYNTLTSMLPLKKNMSNTWLQLYVQHV
jgi:hypothetical protein